MYLNNNCVFKTTTFLYLCYILPDMRKIIIICGLILLLLLVGCSSELVSKNTTSNVVENKTTANEKTSSETKPLIKTVAETISKDVTAETTTKIETTKEIVSLDKNVAKLVAASKEIDNYQYFFQPLIRNQYGTYGGVSYDIYIKGNKAKKVYLSPVRFGDNDFYNAVYLDLDQKTAIGVCDSKSVLCRDILNQTYNLSYDKEKLTKIPKELIQTINPLAKVLEQVVIENQKISVLKYSVEKNMTVQLFVGEYYGLPLKLAIYSNLGDEETLEEKYEFKNLIVGQVKSKDVSLS